MIVFNEDWFYWKWQYNFFDLLKYIIFIVLIFIIVDCKCFRFVGKINIMFFECLSNIIFYVFF